MHVCGKYWVFCYVDTELKAVGRRKAERAVQVMNPGF